MGLIFYGLKTCDTCRKAQQQLEAAGHALKIVDVRGDGVRDKDLKAWLDKVGWQVLVNTRSTTWRGLSEADKESLDNKTALALLKAHPTLMKRPVIVAGGDMHVGWSKAVQQSLIGD